MPALRLALDRQRRELAAAPAVLFGAFALIPLFVLAVLGGIVDSDFARKDWYPAAAFLLALGLVGVLALPAGPRPPRAVWIALAALAGYAAWSYLSIAWADQRADALDGASRTALYAVLFGLFAVWRVPARAALALVGAFALGVAAIGLVQLLGAVAADDPAGYFIDGRFASPIGYANGAAALWSSAFWPCVVVAARRDSRPWTRAAFAGSAVLLGGLALMGQSRGWLFALPIVVVVFVAIAPRRVRTTLTLLLVVAGVGAALPAILDVYDQSDVRLAGALDDAAAAILLAAAVVAAVAWAAAVGDRRVSVSRAAGRRAGAALAVAGALALVGGAGVYVAERGSPFTDVADAWSEFKTKPTPAAGAARLGRLGSNRYDFWRVAWDRFESAPIGGIGADNFQQAYLARARSDEEPLYPHSVELRALSQTGLVGTALLAVALAAALAAAGRALTRRGGAAPAAAAGCLGAFAYWLVHGSVDWFWEQPALGGAAFALLGIAAGLAPRRVVLRPARLRRPYASGAGAALASLAAVALGLVFLAPFWSERYVKQAAEVWATDPESAFDRLDRAAAFNPLSPRPDLVAGSMALQLDRLRDADVRFRAALDREPGVSYAWLELGAIAVNEGRRAEGVRLLRRARRLDPRDGATRRALARAVRGKRIDIAAMNDAYRERYREIGE
ncbi:MAG TPA: O-antigen ligase family protein [Thermoleophilaceae bacterium]